MTDSSHSAEAVADPAKRSPATRKPRGGVAKKRKSPSKPSSGNRHHMIAETAYFRAEARGFAPGNEMEDWLEAEREVERQLQSGRSSPKKSKK